MNGCPICEAGPGEMCRDGCPMRFVGFIEWLVRVVTTGGPTCKRCGAWLPPAALRLADGGLCGACERRCEACGVLVEHSWQMWRVVKQRHSARGAERFRAGSYTFVRARARAHATCGRLSDATLAFIFGRDVLAFDLSTRIS